MKNEERIIEILKRLEFIEELILKKLRGSIGEFIDNQEFLQMMKITSRTAQRWRDIGLIGYSLIEGKVYYNRIEIVDLMMKKYKKKRVNTG
jgi:hypothetical protein